MPTLEPPNGFTPTFDNFFVYVNVYHSVAKSPNAFKSNSDPLPCLFSCIQGVFFRQFNAQFLQKKMGNFKPIEKKRGK